MIALEQHLRARRASGRKLFVPYLTGGLGNDWMDHIRAMAAGGADAIEIGIPFSDPVMDGPTIQEASESALRAGTTPESILARLPEIDIDVPLVVMTYYNIAFRIGHRRFAESLATAGISGTILPDLPLEESGPWREAAQAAGIEHVLLAAPTAPDERLPLICNASRGFVYSIGLVGTTGERSSLAATAAPMARRLKAITDMPVIVGIGVSNGAQAAEVCQDADGVVIASALVRTVLNGATPQDTEAFVRDIRRHLD